MCYNEIMTATPTKESVLVPSLCAAGTWLGLTSVIVLAVSSWHARERAAAEQQAHAIVRTVENCVRPMVMRGMLSDEYSQDLLAEIARLPVLAGAALLNSNGLVIANTGIDTNLLENVVGTNGTCFARTSLLAWARLDISCGCATRCMGMGMGPQGWRSGYLDSSSAHLTLCVAMGNSALLARHRRDWLGASALSAALLLAAAAVVLGWHHHHRAVRYSSQLVLAAVDNRMLQEMNLTAAGLAHEVKNPLGVIRGTAQKLGKSPIAAADCGVIVEEIDRVTSRINEFLSFARPQPPQPERVNLADILRSVHQLLSDDLDDADLSFQPTDCDVNLMVDPAQFRQSLFNLIHNALRFAPRSGPVTIQCFRENGRAHVRVRDSGPGIPAENIPLVFSPYFTTAPDGSGLGLAIVARIAHAHGWTVACGNAPPRGAWFELGNIKLC